MLEWWTGEPETSRSTQNTFWEQSTFAGGLHVGSERKHECYGAQGLWLAHLEVLADKGGGQIAVSLTNGAYRFAGTALVEMWVPLRLHLKSHSRHVGVWLYGTEEWPWQDFHIVPVRWHDTEQGERNTCGLRKAGLIIWVCYVLHQCILTVKSEGPLCYEKLIFITLEFIFHTEEKPDYYTILVCKPCKRLA